MAPLDVSDVADALAEKVRDAAADGRRLRIAGGGSKDFLGYPHVDAESLDVKALRGIISYEPAELVIRVRAGTPLAEVREILAREGQMLGFEPPDFDGEATMGGVIAAGLSGPRRPWYGAARDFVLGLELITGEGKRVAFGGQVMKNVAGYDVSRLSAGAMGTLGVITEVSLKVLPVPKAEITLVRESTAGDSMSLVRTLARRASPLSGSCYADGKLYLRLSGTESSARQAALSLGGEECGDGVWGDLANLRMPVLSDCEELWRVSVPPGTDRFLEEASVIEWGGAQRWLADPDFDPRAVLADHAGHITLFRRGKCEQSVFQPLTPGVERIHRALKAQFDPSGILNHGRMYEGL